VQTRKAEQDRRRRQPPRASGAIEGQRRDDEAGGEVGPAGSRPASTKVVHETGTPRPSRAAQHAPQERRRSVVSNHGPETGRSRRAGRPPAPRRRARQQAPGGHDNRARQQPVDRLHPQGRGRVTGAGRAAAAVSTEVVSPRHVPCVSRPEYGLAMLRAYASDHLVVVEVVITDAIHRHVHPRAAPRRAATAGRARAGAQRWRGG
jgi:hypothetical protein